MLIQQVESVENITTRLGQFVKQLTYYSSQTQLHFIEGVQILAPICGHVLYFKFKKYNILYSQTNVKSI